MVMVCHHLNARVPEDVAFAESRIRRETIAAEDVLHDLGAISRDGLGLAGDGTDRRDDRAHLAGGRAHEGRARIAARGRRQRQRQRADQALHREADDQPGADLRDHHEIGSLEPGKLADIVLWEPKFFGIKPEVVFKGGFPAWSVMGESNASLMTCEPLHLPPAVGRVRPGDARRRRSRSWPVRRSRPASPSGSALRSAASRRAARARWASATCSGTMRRPRSRVDPETYRVEVDGELATCEPWSSVPLGRLYVLK